MPWSANDEEINGLVDSNLKSSPPNPPAVNTAETIRNLLKAYWALSSAQFKEAIEYVDETNSSVFIQDAIAQAQSFALGAESERSLSQAARLAAQAAQTLAETAAANAALAQNPLGEYNVATNTPAQTVTPPAGAIGSYLTITASGNAGFAGSNFASGAALAAGGRLIKKSATQWFYQPPSDLGITKALALEAAAVVTQEAISRGALLEWTDSAGRVIFSIRNDGTTFPPLHQPDVETYDLSAATKEYVNDGKYLTEAGLHVSVIKDSSNVVLSAILKDGTPWPPPAPNMTSPFVSTPVVAASGQKLFDGEYALINPPNKIVNAIYGQWSYPKALYVGTDLWIGGVGRGKNGTKGEIQVSLSRNGGMFQTKVIGRVRTVANDTDDHNCNVLRVDTRTADLPTPFYPIQVFQSEHNTHPLRQWKEIDKNLYDWDTNFANLSPNVSYTQLFVNGLNPNEMLILCRSDSAQPRSWRFTWSTDNGQTWVSKNVFLGDGWMYMMGKTNDAATKVNFAYYAHPVNSDDHRIFVMQLDWATGAIYPVGSSGSPFIANFRTAMTDSGFVPIDPRVGGRVVVQPADTTLNTRLFDIGTNTSGDCLLSYLTYAEGQTMAVYNGSRHRVVSFSLATGAINWDIDAGAGGMPFERRTDVTEWSYYAGNCVLPGNKVCFATYKNKSMIAGGTDIQDNEGMSVVTISEVSSAGLANTKEILRTPNKTGRPEHVANSPFLTLIDCPRYITFNDFESSILVLNYKQLIL